MNAVQNLFYARVCYEHNMLNAHLKHFNLYAPGKFMQPNFFFSIIEMIFGKKKKLLLQLIGGY